MVRSLVRKTGRTLSYWAHPVRARLQPRRFHAYCISVPRSGTHSVAGLFARDYRSAHEPDTDFLVARIRRFTDGATGAADLGRWLERRDKALWLEMESNNRLGIIPGVLVRAFPDAKFVLVVRDCYSWLASYLNHQLATPLALRSPAQGTRDWQFGADRFVHGLQERGLAERGLYTLDGYLSLWAESNRRILAEVPPERLLLLRLDELAQGQGRLASFLGIPPASLDASRGWLDRRPHDASLILDLDREYLEDRVRHHAADLMTRFFPEIGSLDDAVARGLVQT